MDNRAGRCESADGRAAVAHGDLDGRESLIHLDGWRARPHAPQLHHRLSAFGLPDQIRRHIDASQQLMPCTALGSMVAALSVCVLGRDSRLRREEISAFHLFSLVARFA